MEKHTVTNIFRLGAVLVAVALTASAAHATNLLQNGGFEIPGTNATTAANWNIFGNAAVSGTNNTVVTIHTGLASLSAGVTATNVLAGAGGFQDVPSAFGVNNNWRLTGYLLTWINAKITGPDSFAVAQLVFLDSGSNVLLTVESPHYGTDANLPVNTWVPFEVDATAPVGTVTVRSYLMYISDSADNGNAFFDDVSLYNPTSSSTASVSNQPAVQISWPTSSRTNGIDYQIQSTKSLVFTNPPINSVLTNGGFETNVAPWATFNGGGRSTLFARTGAGSMRLSGGANAVPGCDQIVGPASPGQVWDLQGYGYSSSTTGQGITNANTRALIKIAWLNSANAFINVVNGDTNQIGTTDSAPNAGIASAPQMSSASPNDTWTFLEARGTAPAGTVQIQVFCLLVVGSSPDTSFFDDLTLALVTTNTPSQGYSAFGPLWIGNSNTNQVFDPIATSNKFYRVTTP